MTFHERWLKNKEQEQILEWRFKNPGERILELDPFHSYGISKTTMDPGHLNVVAFNWDARTESEIHLRVNCTGSEFTRNKQGGERGVSFELQVQKNTF